MRNFKILSLNNEKLWHWFLFITVKSFSKQVKAYNGTLSTVFCNDDEFLKIMFMDVCKRINREVDWGMTALLLVLNYSGPKY